MRKGFVTTVIAFQLILIAILSFTKLSMSKETSAIVMVERKLATYKVLELSETVYSSWQKLNESNANPETFNKVKNYILNEYREKYPSLTLEIYTFNKTLLSCEIKHKYLNISKSLYVENV